MHGFTLQLRMMRRRLVGNALVILLLVVTTLFLLLYPGVIENAAEKMVTAGKGILVNGWAYHPKDDLYISVPVELRDGMMETGYVKSYIARSTVQFSALEEIIQKQGEGDTPEARRAFILQKLKVLSFSITADKGSFFGVNALTADPDLLAMEEQITWLEGYDSSCLQGNEQVCLYPANRGVKLGENVEILLNRPLNNSKYDQDRLLTTFKVVGTFSWGAQEPAAYCPLATLEALVAARKDFAYDMNHFSFVMEKNEKIPALKDFFVAHQLHTGENLRIAIDDRMYEKAMAPLEKNLNLLQGLQYIFYVLVILLGFFLCFLVARRRKPEYAIMRMLGEPAVQVVLKSLVEQLLLCLVGVGIGLLLMLVSKGSDLQFGVCLVILAGYCLGAALAVGLTVRVDVMSILREKE